MLKPTKTYKMSKQTKRSLATIVDPIERGIQKRLMIQAELHSAIAPKREKRPQGTSNYKISENAGTSDE
jgi:hypothetical protein